MSKFTAKCRTLLGATALLSAVALGAQEASAHAKLMNADPAAGTTIAAPSSIKLTFDDDLAGKLSRVKLLGPNGKQIPVKRTESSDIKTLAVTPAAKLKTGTYTVDWSAVSTDDGHKTHGRYSFFVK